MHVAVMIASHLGAVCQEFSSPRELFASFFRTTFRSETPPKTLWNVSPG